MIKRYGKIFLLMFVLAPLLFTGCEKTTVVNSEDLLGEWVAESKADTIRFVDKGNFFHSSKDFSFSNYEYSVEGDSMTVLYIGFLKIYVQPTTHYFELKEDELMIDFSNDQCFGFPKEKMHYKRINRLILE